MAISQLRSSTKSTAGRLKPFRKKKLYELGRQPVHTKLGKMVKKSIRVRGGNRKIKYLSHDTVNLFDPKEKKVKKVLIKAVVGNPANRHFARRNILTKGAEIETELGKARITSRPGQEGSLNAVLIKS
jgi:small subunit ribosomal protein S8e